MGIKFKDVHGYQDNLCLACNLENNNINETIHYGDVFNLSFIYF